MPFNYMEIFKIMWEEARFFQMLEWGNQVWPNTKGGGCHPYLANMKPIYILIN